MPSTCIDSTHLRLLLVEDEDLDIEIFRKSIPQEIQLDIARSLGEARQKLSVPTEPDCAVVDLHLPDGSGLELISDLGSAPVVVLSGSSEQCGVQEAMARGAQDYLSKNNINPETLLRTIAFAIERRKCNTLRLQLEHGERLQQVGLMAAALAHEIGNPATFVQANLELLDQDLAEWLAELKPQTSTNTSLAHTRVLEAQELVREALSGINNISSLVGQLRSISRPNGRPITSEVDLSKTVEHALAIAGTRIRKAKVSKHYPQTPVLVSGQPERIGQILNNFLLNAIQALESQAETNKTIDVSVEYHSTYGRVRIVDNGPGIPPNIDVDQLFQPFISTRHENGGSGLGLAVSIQIAESLGGYIEIKRRTDRSGVSAELVLPLVGCPPLKKPQT